MDWTRLSPHDFEDLVGDLLEDVLKCRLERFGPGKDGGIDLRNEQVGRLTLVQCKHFFRSGWHPLQQALKKEQAKVRARKPSRYIIATSLDLSPANKNQILSMFTPWMRGTDDCLGGSDILAMLRKQPDVEISHPRLWAQSSAVIERLLNAGVFTNTTWTIEEAETDARVFVRPTAYADARKMLMEHHTCILSGPPGIGKTMLARMLLREYVKFDFEPIAARSSIDEITGLLKQDCRQVFFFDDFLGQTDITEASLERNEDDRLVRFINRVAASKDKRFILTTREYVLRDAQMMYERLRRAETEQVLRKIILDLTKYTRLDRARILYNHLWLAAAGDSSFYKPFASRTAWKPVIDHVYFNPRVIQLGIVQAIRQDIRPAILPKQLKEFLDDPTQVWNTVFRAHLNNVERLRNSTGARNRTVVSSTLGSISVRGERCRS